MLCGRYPEHRDRNDQDGREYSRQQLYVALRQYLLDRRRLCSIETLEKQLLLAAIEKRFKLRLLSTFTVVSKKTKTNYNKALLFKEEHKPFSTVFSIELIVAILFEPYEVELLKL